MMEVLSNKLWLALQQNHKELLLLLKGSVRSVVISIDGKEYTVKQRDSHVSEGNMPTNMYTVQELADKVDWEGGLGEFLFYTNHIDDYDVSDELKKQFRKTAKEFEKLNTLYNNIVETDL